MMNNVTTLKYWSWIGAFSLSILFWCQLVWLTFLIDKTSLRRGFLFYTRRLRPQEFINLGCYQNVTSTMCYL
jgi:hypothetical protein